MVQLIYKYKVTENFYYFNVQTHISYSLIIYRENKNYGYTTGEAVF